MSTFGAQLFNAGAVPRNARSISSVNSRIIANGLRPKNRPTGNMGSNKLASVFAPPVSCRVSVLGLSTFTSAILCSFPVTEDHGISAPSIALAEASLRKGKLLPQMHAKRDGHDQQQREQQQTRFHPVTHFTISRAIG